VEKGTIKVIIDNKENIIEEKSFIEIPPEKTHKVINETDEEAQFIAYEVPPDDDDFELVE
jgi:mannose-6-phosphate isomerase-like protein (cupin superfamily)